MSFLDIVNWLFLPPERQMQLAYHVEQPEVAPITIDAKTVTSVLKGRRMRRRRTIFRGFKSPPGRF